MRIIKDFYYMIVNHFISPDSVPTGIAIIAVLFGLYQWFRIKTWNQKAIINSVFEEIRHNLNMTEKLHPPIEDDAIIFILKELKKISKGYYYPNPTDSADTAERLLSPYIDIIGERFSETSYFITLRQDAIVNALTSGQILNPGSSNIKLNSYNERI